MYARYLFLMPSYPANNVTQIFGKLKEKIDPAEQRRREQELNARIQAQYEKTQSRIAELVRKTDIAELVRG